MSTKLEELQSIYKDPKQQAQASDDLVLIKNEITKELQQAPTIKYTCLDSLDIKHFSPGIIGKTTDYLNALNNY